MQRVPRHLKLYFFTALIALSGLGVSPVDAVTLTPTFIQNNVTFSGSASPTISTPFTSPNTAGNFIVAYVVWATTSAPTVTDSAGNTYTAVGTPSLMGGSGNSNGQIFYAKNIAAGPNTVTATFSSSPSFRFLYIHEYANIDKTNPLDQTINANGSSTAVDSGPFTTTFPTELLFSGSMSFDTESAGAGWTARSTFFNGLTQDQVVTSTGTYNATATIASSQGWMIQAASFHAAQVPPSAPSAAPTLQGGGSTTSNNKPTFLGSCTNGTTVTIYVDGVAAAPTQTCSSGAYTITLANALSNGTRAITSSFTDGGGTSPQSPALVLTVNAVLIPLAPNTGVPRQTSTSWPAWIMVGVGSSVIVACMIIVFML